MMFKMKNILGLYVIGIIYCTVAIKNVNGWGSTSSKKVLLKEVYSLTLYDGKMTNGRRSSPVPQLECINEGSATCSDYKPKIVQCTNRGSDGVDAQWECKSDMDSRYKFGFIEVSCEGYDYPEDPYVLAGSCGLKYTLDHDAGGSHSTGNNYYDSSYPSYRKSSSWKVIMADIITYAGIALMMYAAYVTCCRSNRNVGDTTYSSTNDDNPSDNGSGRRGYGWFGGDSSTNNYNQGSSYTDDASCRNRGSSRANQGGGSGLGGFWTGAATGGLLGYMFGGGRNSYGYGSRSSSYGGRPYGSGGMFSSGGGFGGGSSSGTRTSTGFGGTSRR